MDVFVARQPIYTVQKKLYGYELLYRKSSNNFYEGEDDTRSTLELIGNSFLTIGFDELIDNTWGFLNFSEELLLNEAPKLLPKHKVVVEVLERVELSEAVLEALRELKAQGYVLALDDFTFDLDNPLTDKLVKLADIIKVVFPFAPAPAQAKFLQRYRQRIRFLAEQVEDEEQFQQAKRMGFVLFQGYYFSRPIMMNAREIETFRTSTARIMHELNQPEPDFKAMAAVFEQDTGLSYKLLKLANSAYFISGRPVRTIQQALVQIGLQELSGWVYVLFLRSIQNAENAELIKLSVIRGKLISLLCGAQGNEGLAADGLFVGIFSVLDTLMHQDMQSILDSLPLRQSVKDSLLGLETPLSPYMRIVTALESARWEDLEPELARIGMPTHICMEKYLEALRWQQSLPV